MCSRRLSARISSAPSKAPKPTARSSVCWRRAWVEGRSVQGLPRSAAASRPSRSGGRKVWVLIVAVGAGGGPLALPRAGSRRFGRLCSCHGRPGRRDHCLWLDPGLKRSMKALAAGAAFFARRLVPGSARHAGDPRHRLCRAHEPRRSAARDHGAVRAGIGARRIAPRTRPRCALAGTACPLSGRCGDRRSRHLHYLQKADGRGGAREIPRKFRAGAGRKPYRAAFVAARWRLCRRPIRNARRQADPGLERLGISVPVFVTGIILITVFSVWLGWLPAFGRGETVDLGAVADGTSHAGRARASVAAGADALVHHAAAVHPAGAWRHAR